jgi:hypothetical protein
MHWKFPDSSDQGELRLGIQNCMDFRRKNTGYAAFLTLVRNFVGRRLTISKESGSTPMVGVSTNQYLRDAWTLGKKKSEPFGQPLFSYVGWHRQAIGRGTLQYAPASSCIAENTA